jgi:hypothetical protein
MRKEVSVLENRVLRKILGTKKDEVTGNWEQVHNEQLHDRYLPDTTRVRKLRRMRWKGQTEDDSYIQNFGGRTSGQETT